MTWHHAENYGTAYRAYALKTLIEQPGYKMDLIDYHRLNGAPMNVPNISAIVSSKFISLCRKIVSKKSGELIAVFISATRTNGFACAISKIFKYSQIFNKIVDC